MEVVGVVQYQWKVGHVLAVAHIPIVLWVASNSGSRDTGVRVAMVGGGVAR